MPKSRRSAALFAAFAFLAITAVGLAKVKESPTPPVERPPWAAWRMIERVVDGDTLELDGGEIVRLLGVDAPESSRNRKLGKDLQRMTVEADAAEVIDLGKEATRFVKGIAEQKKCWLEFDASSTDIYGRTIAYVHLREGGILNEIIITHGYGRAYLDYPFKYKRRYIGLQREAMENNRGLWAASEFDVSEQGGEK